MRIRREEGEEDQRGQRDSSQCKISQFQIKFVFKCQMLKVKVTPKASLPVFAQNETCLNCPQPPPIEMGQNGR